MGHDTFSPAGASNGLGNLADELADAWDEDEEEEVDMNFQEAEKTEEPRDSGVDVQDQRQEQLAPPEQQTNGHRRKGSEYDGSDYGEDSEVENSGSLPPSLVTRMDQVENLAKRGIDNFGSEGDGVVRRVIDGLKDLGSQANVEGGATRYICALRIVGVPC